MARIILFIMVIMGVINLGKAQNAPLSQAQLLKLQSLSLNQLTEYLNGQGWKAEKNQKNQLSEYFNYSLGYKLDKWNPARTNQWEGTLFVYYQKGFPNLIVYQTNNRNFANLKPTYVQSIKEKNFEISIIVRYGLAMEFRNYYNDNSRKRYSVLCYDIGSVKDLLSREKRKAEEEKVKQKTEEDKEAAGEKERIKNYSLNLQAGNENFELRNFDKAIYFYELAKSYLLPGEESRAEELNNRISDCNKEKEFSKYDEYKKAADDLFKQKRYEESLLNYRSAYKINSSENYVAERISCLEEMKKAVQSASREQSYRKINPKGYSDFNDLNYRALNSMMNYEKGQGFLDYSVNIRFDEKGNNISSLKINTISNDQLLFYLNDISASSISASVLNLPCISAKIPIASNDLATYSVKWESQILKAHAGKEISFIDGVFTTKTRDSMLAFIKRQPDKFGIYTFHILDKSLNGKKYQDLSLISYKDKRIPVSMLVPGLSSVKSSEGNYGKIKMAGFFLSTALSIGSKIYSDYQYKKYRDPEITANRNSYYQHANNANKVFLISGGIAATIYLYDLTSFFAGKRGLRNKNLRTDLKNGPIVISESSFQP